MTFTHLPLHLKCLHFYPRDTADSKDQRWVFQLVEDKPPVVPPSDKTFESLFFTLTPKKLADTNETFDIIIIGTGIGGGIIAGDLFDTNSRLGELAKSVLVIEKGGLPFHSHCLNASRPAGFGEDRGQQNDTFFAMFRDNYKFSDTDMSDWKGGPMYGLGGRSAAWGLFAPRIHDETLRNQFAPDSQLFNDLIRKWYQEAEFLMKLSLPATTTTHQNVMERLNMKNNEKPRDVRWQWGRIASEFREDGNFDFAEGAYSTIDKILEIAMSKKRDGNNVMEEHPHWKILLRTDVRAITWDGGDSSQATGVKVRDADGKLYTFKLKTDVHGKVLPASNIVLAAGSVGSPAILMRSGEDKTEFLKKHNGLHITDHDIFAKAYTFQYHNAADKDRVGSMKLQTYVRTNTKGDRDIALANMAIDASSFLPREFLPNEFFRNEDYLKLIAAFIRPNALNKNNTIKLDTAKDILDREPIVTIKRDPPFKNSDSDVKVLRDLTIEARQVLASALSIDIDTSDEDLDNFFKPLQLGGVAHELGSIPMPGKDKKAASCVDHKLELVDHKGVYVCDLSVFPFSPEVNPTVTLAALALRLSRDIVPRIPYVTDAQDTIYVMNQTGENIQVFVSNRASVTTTSETVPETLGPGQIARRKRKVKVDESVLVYRLQFNSDCKFLDKPVLYLAEPGVVLTIV